MRNPLAFTPFTGGKRICVGKTFAEVLMKFTLPIIYHHFDFKLSNPEHHINKPTVHINASKPSVIPAKLILRNPVLIK